MGWQMVCPETDHPATRAWKRERMAEAQIALPPWLILVPVDFERDDVGEKLVARIHQSDRNYGAGADPAVLKKT
jgi:O-methyltransferase involved in polyketide biosynthesis